MTKEELALEVIARLKKEYPSAGCTLDYDQAWKLLVSVRLAAQCTDARVNVVVEGLCEVSGCGIAGGCRAGGDRGDRPAVWTWQKQSQGHQCMYENPS